MSCNLRLDATNTIAILTMDAPETRNALDAGMRCTFEKALYEIKKNDRILCVILTGAGKAFCAGGNLSDMRQGIDVAGGRNKIKSIHEWAQNIIKIEKPFIAAVNGAAIGAGFGLALACDMIIATTQAKFGATFNKVGLIPDYGTMYLLPRAVGMARAKDIALTSRLVSAQELYQAGAVKGVVEPDKLMETAMSIAELLSKGAPYAIGLSKRLMQMSYECSLEQMLEYESLAQGICYQTADHREGVNAFFEKRPSRFIGK